MSYPYLHIARASDLEGRDRRIYRLFETLPGVLAWGTMLAVVFFSWARPHWVAFFIIAFDLYWLIKTVYLSAHLRANWRRIRQNLGLNWEERLQNLKWNHIWQMVILPFYKEDYEVIKETAEALLNSNYPKDRMIIVLAIEERAGSEAEKISQKIKDEYEGKFAHFIVTCHPKDLPEEMPGKGSNISWAAEEARKKVLDPNEIPYKDILVSAFDIDTRVYPQYFLCLTYNFLTCEYPFRSSFQPVPLYNNNIWAAPALSRVVATSGTFWQMMQQERPERLVSFSSHSINFKTLHEIGYWQKNMVSEDSRIFWNAFMTFDGDYRVVPLSYPVSMDANLAPTLYQTAKNVYKQQRRWTWGVENIPYVLFGFLKNKKIALKTRLRHSFIQLEGFWSLATNPIMIFLLGWLPLLLGGEAFNDTLLSYNLPRTTRGLMIIAMMGLVVSAIISTTLLPPRPLKYTKGKYISMVLQWILIPITIIFFGSVPGIDAQTRLMLAKYMGFWVTPKYKT